jgi:DsbC/DsbD-like thiol-disulfide interchange protein
VPDGFTVGDLLFPCPSRLEQAGGIVNFGYENKVLLMATVTPGPDVALADQTQFKFSADVSWLVCQDECIQGKDTVELVLPADILSRSANADLFDPWIRAIPVTPKEAIDEVKDAAVDPSTHVITIDWKNAIPADIQFFPGATDDYQIKDVVIKTTGVQTTTVAFTARPLAGNPPAAATIEAVVAYKDQAGQRRGLVLNVALSAEKAQ